MILDRVATAGMGAVGPTGAVARRDRWLFRRSLRLAPLARAEVGMEADLLCCREMRCRAVAEVVATEGLGATAAAAVDSRRDDARCRSRRRDIKRGKLCNKSLNVCRRQLATRHAHV